MRRLHLPATAALAALVLFAVSANIVFASLLRVSDEFQIPVQALANVSAVQFAGFFLASIAGGFLADMIGKKHVLQGGSLLVALGAFLWSQADGTTAAFTAGFVMGLGGGILEAISTALLTDLFPRRGKLVLNLSQVAYCLGAVGGPLIMAWLLPKGVSWRVFFAATACGGALLFVLFSASDVPRPKHAAGNADDDAAIRSVAPRLPVLSAAVWVPCIVIFLYVTAEMGTATFLTAFLADARGAAEQYAILGLSLFWGMMILGRLICAALPEEQSHERVIGGLMLAAGLCSSLHLLTDAWPVDLVLFALTGLAFAGTWPLIVGLAATRFPQRTGAVVGLTAGIGSLGCIAAPPILGTLIGGPHPASAFALAGALLAAGGALIFCPCHATVKLTGEMQNGDTRTSAESAE